MNDTHTVCPPFKGEEIDVEIGRWWLPAVVVDEAQYGPGGIAPGFFCYRLEDGTPSGRSVCGGATLVVPEYDVTPRWRRRGERRPYQTPTLTDRGPIPPELRRQLASEQLERGGAAAFEGPRLHELLLEQLDQVADDCGDYACCPYATAEKQGALRLAIADALRARLGSSPALEDFVTAPDASGGGQ